MSEPVTWAEVRIVIAQLNKTLDLVQAQLKPEPEQASPFTGTIFDDLFGKKP